VNRRVVDGAVLASLVFAVCSCCFACVVRELAEEERPKMDYTSDPPTPEEARLILQETGEDWLYGEGFGSTLMTVGGVLLFPFYGIYVLGDSLLNLGGYDIQPSAALPQGERAQWDGIYSDVAGAPGRVAAAIAGREFRTEDSIMERKSDAEERANSQGAE